MNLSHFLEIQGQFVSFISIFHYVISHWIHSLRTKPVYLSSLDQIELIPHSRSHWKYHFYQTDVNDSFLFTLLPPFWKIRIHFSTLSSLLIDTCPHVLQHHWISFLTNVQFHLHKTSIRQPTEPLRPSFSHFLSQLLIDSQFQCPYCISHQQWIASSPFISFPFFFPKRILYHSSVHQELKSSLLLLISHCHVHIRSSSLQCRILTLLYEHFFSSWKLWVQTVDQYNDIQRQCILQIESIWLKEVPFFPSSPIPLQNLFHLFFQLYTDIDNWELDISTLQHFLSQTSFLLLLLFPFSFSHQDKTDQSFAYNNSQVYHFSSISFTSFEQRFLDTHPLRLGEFFEKRHGSSKKTTLT